MSGAVLRLNFTYTSRWWGRSRPVSHGSLTFVLDVTSLLDSNIEVIFLHSVCDVLCWPELSMGSNPPICCQIVCAFGLKLKTFFLTSRWQQYLTFFSTDFIFLSFTFRFLDYPELTLVCSVYFPPYGKPVFPTPPIKSFPHRFVVSTSIYQFPYINRSVSELFVLFHWLIYLFLCRQCIVFTILAL